MLLNPAGIVHRDEEDIESKYEKFSFPRLKDKKNIRVTSRGASQALWIESLIDFIGGNFIFYKHAKLG